MRTFHEALDQVALADSLGFHHVWSVEHHFLEEYSHSSSPELFLAAAAMRTKQIRLGHGIVQLPPQINHPVRVAERIGVLDLLSRGRVDFGTGEGSGALSSARSGVDAEPSAPSGRRRSRRSCGCSPRSRSRASTVASSSCPRRNVVPKPLQKPHPPLWVAAPRPESILNAAQ